VQLQQQLQEVKAQSDQTMLDVQKQRAEERSELAAAQSEAAQVGARSTPACLTCCADHSLIYQFAGAGLVDAACHLNIWCACCLWCINATARVLHARTTPLPFRTLPLS
jgi:hypothetical protein